MECFCFIQCGNGVFISLDVHVDDVLASSALALESKLSHRANREDLIEKHILTDIDCAVSCNLHFSGFQPPKKKTKKKLIMLKTPSSFKYLIRRCLYRRWIQILRPLPMNCNPSYLNVRSVMICMIVIF